MNPDPNTDLLFWRRIGWYALLPQPDAEKIMPGAALASTAASAAFLLGNLAARNSKQAAPFEYTKKQIGV